MTEKIEKPNHWLPELGIGVLRHGTKQLEEKAGPTEREAKGDVQIKAERPSAPKRQSCLHS